MGLMHELSSITPARIDAFLDQAEDPKSVLARLVGELEAHIRVVAEGENRARAALKSAQRRCDEAAGRVQRLARGADLAVRQGEDALAREALAAQLQAEQRLEHLEDGLANSEHAVCQACEVRQRLSRQLENLRTKAQELHVRLDKLKRERAAPGANSLLRRIARMDRLDGEAPPVYLQADVAHARTTLDQRLRALEREAEVERRMELLRKNRKGNDHARSA